MEYIDTRELAQLIYDNQDNDDNTVAVRAMAINAACALRDGRPDVATDILTEVESGVPWITTALTLTDVIDPGRWPDRCTVDHLVEQFAYLLCFVQPAQVGWRAYEYAKDEVAHMLRHATRWLAMYRESPVDAIEYLVDLHAKCLRRALVGLALVASRHVAEYELPAHDTR